MRTPPSQLLEWPEVLKRLAEAVRTYARFGKPPADIPATNVIYGPALRQARERFQIGLTPAETKQLEATGYPLDLLARPLNPTPPVPEADTFPVPQPAPIPATVKSLPPHLRTGPRKRVLTPTQAGGKPSAQPTTDLPPPRTQTFDETCRRFLHVAEGCTSLHHLWQTAPDMKIWYEDVQRRKRKLDDTELNHFMVVEDKVVDLEDADVAPQGQTTSRSA